MNIHLADAPDSNIQIDLDTIVDRVTGRLLTTCGPLSKQEIVTLTGLSGHEVATYSNNYDSAYEWLVIMATKVWLKRNDDAQGEMSSVKELNEALLTDNGRYRFLVVFNLMHLCSSLPMFVHDQGRFSAEVGVHLTYQRHLGTMLKGVEKSEALVSFAKHASLLMVSLSIDDWELLLNDKADWFPFTMQEFNDYVASA